jgi:D-aspartate ligase
MVGSQVPVAVVGLDVNGLGVVRALHRAGIRALALDTDFSKPPARTRYARKIPVSETAGAGLIDALCHLRKQFSENPVLILTQESSVATLSAAKDRIAPLYRFVMPEHGLMEQLMSKTGFQALAERHGFPIPRAVCVDKSGGPQAVRELKFPCVMKPTKKDAGYGARFAKAYRVEGYADVERLWRDMRELIDEVIVQEWIEGGDSSVYFCLQYRPKSPGRPVSFVGRKLSQWPPLVGGTAACEPAPDVKDELLALTDRFFEAVGFAGLCSMEYKRDDRDGRFYMVEPTVGRTDYQEEVAVLNGVNIPYAAYCDAAGLALPQPEPGGTAAMWRDTAGYARALLAGGSAPRPAPAPGLRVYDAIFRFDDPMPYLALRWEGIARRLRK